MTVSGSTDELTPYRALPPPPIPTMGRRLAARSIDWLVVGLPLLLGASGLYLGQEDPTIAPVGLAIAAFIVYEFTMNLTLGATVGKLLMGCRVVTVHSSAPLDFHRAALRALIPMACGIIALLGMGESGSNGWLAGLMLGVLSFTYVSPAYDPRRRGWADRAAGTTVIRVR